MSATTIGLLHPGEMGVAVGACLAGHRWSGEMEEIAASMTAAGLPGGFHQAAAEVFRRIPPGTPAEPAGQALAAVLSALLARADPAPSQQPVRRSAR